ncbi:MAG: hypothetical protein IPP73_18520 [Chitinophagaceae bacterium]|nr:hypothetical protein [Chitinophagaceae bacterium]
MERQKQEHKTTPVNMTTVNKKIYFDKSGYCFIGLLALAFLGFWNSYFSKFFTGQNDFTFYYHFHATMMIGWVGLLITQPLLIRQKKFRLHRLLGRVTYFMMPLLLVSVLLVLNSGLKRIPENESDKITFNLILFPFRDFILLSVAFLIGIYYRRKVHIHARAMIITGIVFIEPALFRFLGGVVFKNNGILAFYIGIGFILSLLIILIIMERKHKSGRWLFPSLFAIYSVAYLIAIFEIQLTFMDPFVRWFARLSLT